MSGDVHVQFCERPGVRFPRATHRNIYVRSHRAGDRVMSSVCRFVTTQLRLKVNVSKSAVAQPEERRFLGFRITNDGRQRQIAPQALDRFKMRVRGLTRRTLGVSLPQLVEKLAPYFVGWRGYFGFCDAPRVLSNLDAWIRRRLRMYLWRSGSLGGTASRNCGDEASRSSTQQSPRGQRPGSGECPATRPSSKPCATAISTRSDFQDSLCLPTHNSIEPPWYVTRMPGGVTGKAREGLPMSIKGGYGIPGSCKPNKLTVCAPRSMPVGMNNPAAPLRLSRADRNALTKWARSATAPYAW